MRKRVIARPVGSSVRLKCTASGNPRPDIVWLKDNRPLLDGQSGAGGEDGRRKRWTLSLKNLTPEQSGKYTCHVSNRAGEINATYKVEVIRESPRVLRVHVADAHQELSSKSSLHVCADRTELPVKQHQIQACLSCCYSEVVF